MVTLRWGLAACCLCCGFSTFSGGGNTHCPLDNLPFVTCFRKWLGCPGIAGTPRHLSDACSNSPAVDQLDGRGTGFSHWQGELVPASAQHVGQVLKDWKFLRSLGLGNSRGTIADCFHFKKDSPLQQKLLGSILPSKNRWHLRYLFKVWALPCIMSDLLALVEITAGVFGELLRGGRGLHLKERVIAASRDRPLAYFCPSLFAVPFSRHHWSSPPWLTSRVMKYVCFGPRNAESSAKDPASLLASSKPG